jgi:hypothetical protein
MPTPVVGGEKQTVLRRDIVNIISEVKKKNTKCKSLTFSMYVYHQL